MTEWYTLSVALFAAIGTFLFVSFWCVWYVGCSNRQSRALIQASPQQVSMGYATRFDILQGANPIFLSAIAHGSWINYMGHPSKGLTGAVCLDSLQYSGSI
jgi:hypothetical protein